MTIPKGFIITADTHLKCKPYPDTIHYGVRLVEDLCTLAQQRNLKHIIIAGDFLDGPSLDPLIHAYRALERATAKGFRFIILRGNHEVMLASNLRHSPLRLLTRVATIINEPRIIRGPGWTLWLMPWYPPGPYLSTLKKITDLAINETNKRILITHVGLKEGKVSASNLSIHQPVSLHDIVPDLWDLVLLGDYHAHQKLKEHVMYMGSPTYQNFGDRDIVGPWHLDLIGGAKVYPLSLPRFYPKFQQWQVPDESALPLKGYSDKNRNRIYAAVTLTGQVARMYPEAEIWPLDTKAKTNHGRLQNVTATNPFEVFDAFLDSKAYNTRDHKKYKEVGYEFLKKGTSQ